MNSEQANILTDEDREILQQLANVIYPDGGQVFEFEPGRLPAIAPAFGDGVATKPFFIDVADPTIRSLAVRAIAAGIGAKMVNHSTVTVQTNLIDPNSPGKGAHRKTYLTADDKPERPIFENMIAWYNGLKKNNIFNKLHYTSKEIEAGLWNYLNGDHDFLLDCAGFWALPGGRGLPIETVKVSHKLEKNKVYIEKFGQQLSLMFNNEEMKLIKAEKIDIVGMDLNVTENDCLFAIQSMLSDNNYSPTWTDEATGKQGFAFTAPVFLDACGVPKKKDKAGKMQHYRRGRQKYMDALNQLSRRTFVIVYGSKPDEKGDRWEKRSVEILFKLHTLVKVTKTGREYIQGYAITDYDHSLGLDIVDYFLLMPRGINTQIRQLTGRGHTRGYDRFISNMFIVANEKRRLETQGKSPDWTIEFNHSTILKRPEFAAMAAKRNYSMIWRQWRAYCELGVQMGYIEKVETVNGKNEKKDVIKLNRQKFCEIWPTMNLEKQ